VRISFGLALRSILLGLVMLFVSATGAAAASAWQAPLVPVVVTRHFERPPTPYAAGHRGVDLRGTPGEAVLAAGAGEVSYAGLLAGRGVVVVVHGTLRTTYEPVQPRSHAALG
jgi:murein DD-endopeptidase MepM/ murein hydrolase activator NlpD